MIEATTVDIEETDSLLLDLTLHLFFCQLNSLSVLSQIGWLFYSSNKYWAGYSPY